MQIKRLKLSGFKSFVDSAELRIEPGLTGIVGPNGCGKSNLLEAIRWVMGESSAKSMRGGGMEDVIFAGTATRPQRDFAEVAILAEREAHEITGPIAATEAGELEVMRRIERGAGSAYRANGRDVRAKDIALIFADAATGAHSPALVSQGKIAAVISAKPAERRMMLEEAAGIAGLHVRRKDAEQKLRATETNLARLDDILADMESRANALRRQAKAAERYTRLTEQIRIAEARLIYARWRDAAKAADAAREEAKQAETLVVQAQEAQQAAAAYQNEAVKHLAIQRAEAQKARDAANEAGHRLATLRSEQASLIQRRTDLEAQAVRLEEDKAREGSLAHDAAQAIERLTAEAEQIAARVKETEAIRPDFDASIARANSAARDAELDLAKAMAKQASEQAELRVAHAALNSAQSRLDRTARDRQRIEQELAGLAQAAPLEQARDTALELQDRARAERTQAEAAIAAAERERAAAADTRSTAESALSSAKAALAALDSEAAALRKTVDSGTNRNRALDRIKAAPGYERALAAALGDDLEAAIGAEGKRHWIGAARQESDPAIPADCTSLAEHVTAPSELARRLSQILVAQSDAGQPLAVGQRFVTLDGQLRRWDGYIAIEGGAAAAERLIRLNRLDAIAAGRPETAAQVDAATASLTSAGAAAQAASEALASGRTALNRADQMLRDALRAADEATLALDRIKGRHDELQARLAEATTDHRAAQSEFEAAQTASADLPDGGDTANLVTALQQSSEKARLAVSQLQAEQAMTDRALGADRDRLNAAQSEVKSWRARAGEASRRMEDMGRRATEIAEQRESLDGKPEAIARAIAALDESSHVLLESAEACQAAERGAEDTLRAAETRHAQTGEALAAARETRAGATARAENQEQRRIEMGRISGERFECPAPVLPEKLGFDSADVADAGQESEMLEKLTQDRERIGPVNLVAAQELADLEESQTKSRAESDELTQAIHRLRGSIGSLNREGRARLLTAFEAVDGHFQRLFTALFNGGQAHLKLIDSDDPLEAGLEIMAQPPGKKLSTLTLLSGGEQALTAIALIFGLFLTNPAPICVLDEVDAPLDDANVERFCDLLDKMVQDTRTRYLIVTHNAVTMSRMHRLFGVTMIEKGVSRLVSVDLGGAEELLAAE